MVSGGLEESACASKQPIEQWLALAEEVTSKTNRMITHAKGTIVVSRVIQLEERSDKSPWEGKHYES